MVTHTLNFNGARLCIKDYSKSEFQESVQAFQLKISGYLKELNLIKVCFISAAYQELIWQDLKLQPSFPVDLMHTLFS